jgi:uncharacterized peroxidase-related enzyme
MSWIKTIPYEKAESKLRRIYDKVKGPENNIDNVLLIHSLRPHTLAGHMTLYKSVLHNSNNQLPKWYMESIGVFVSYLNKCNYCVQHHYNGLKRLLDDNDKSERFFEAATIGSISDFFGGKELKGIEYARKLTISHTEIKEEDIEKLRIAGFSDGEILEINQVTSYFNYVNRMVVGLGVNLDGDIIGLSPGDSDDPKNWSHH